MRIKSRISTVIIVFTVFSMAAATPVQAQDLYTMVSIMFLSNFAPTSPTIDGIVSTGEWSAAAPLTLSNGIVLIQNDLSTLYILLDITGDTVNDPPQELSLMDSFELSIDVDHNDEITENVDIIYSPIPGSHQLGMRYYINSRMATPLTNTHSQLGASFGKSFSSQQSHQIWELAISLDEISGRGTTQSVSISFQISSTNPSFTEVYPKNALIDYSDKLEIALATTQADLLILADQSFNDALKPLKAHKDYTGISSYILSWQNLNHSFWAKGRDVPERIKKGISAYVQSCGTKYVMLVGDSDRFPVRYIKAYDTEWGSKYYPSDLYYADLYNANGGFDYWDYDNDNIFGEMSFAGGTVDNNVNLDRVNLYPDVMVGRVPASTVPEVMQYTNKVINYEYAAYQADWLNKALFIVDGGSGAFGSPSKKDLITKYLPGFSIFKQYQSNAPYDDYTIDQQAAEINSRLNSGVGFVNFYGHGNKQIWDKIYDPHRMVGVFSSNKWHDYFGIGEELPMTGDFNGDGFDDAIIFIRDTKTGTGAGDVYVTLSTGSSFGTAAKWHDYFSLGTSVPRIGDCNGDGRDDIISFEQGTSGDVYVALSTGSSFGPATKWHEMFAKGNEWPEVGDFNGDGKDDIITFIRSTKSGPGAGDVLVSLSNGSSFGPITKWHEMFSIGQERPAIGDFDGDGKDDIITFVLSTKPGAGAADVFVALSTGTKFGSAGKWHAYFGVGNEWPEVGDFDGDGKDDIIVFIRNTKVDPGVGDTFVSFSTGSGFASSKMMNADFCKNGEWPEVGDFTGDGLSDIVSFVRDVKTGNEQADVNVAKMVPLNNSDKLPIVFAMSCYTGRFIFNRDYYQDVNKTEWKGDASTTKPDRPEPMSIQPAKYDRDSMAESFLVKSKSGAIAYIGATSASEHGMFPLDEYFFEAYQKSIKSPSPTLGALWDSARTQFITKQLTGKGMGGYYAYPHIHKVILFGDPSLRVGGIPPRISIDILPPGPVKIPLEWIQDISLIETPPDPFITTRDHEHLELVTTTQQVVVTTTTPSESAIEIAEFFGEYHPEERIDVLIARGTAIGVRLIEVTLLAGGEQTFIAEVNPETGEWEAIFESVQEEGVCGQPIALVANSLDPPQELFTVMELEELPCFSPEPPSEEICVIENVEVILEGPRPPEADFVEQIIVIGSATGCELIEVRIVCGEELSTVVEVDSRGKWEAVFEGRLAGCFYGQPIEVVVCSLEPAGEECTIMYLELVPPEEPPQTTESPDEPRPDTSTDPIVTSPPPTETSPEQSPTPGFAYVELLFAILALFSYRKRRKK